MKYNDNNGLIEASLVMNSDYCKKSVRLGYDLIELKREVSVVANNKVQLQKGISTHRFISRMNNAVNARTAYF